MNTDLHPDSDDFVALLTHTLDERASQLPTVGTDAITDRVLPRGRRVLRRRRAATSVAVAAVASAVAATGWLATRGQQTTPIGQTPSTSSSLPSASSSPSANRSTPSLPSGAPASEMADAARKAMAGQLPVGAAIDELPRAERVGEVVRVVLPTIGDTISTVVLDDSGMVRQIVQISDGWLVATSSVDFTGGDFDPGSTLWFIAWDGSDPVALHRGLSTTVLVNWSSSLWAVGVMTDESTQTSTLMVGSSGRPGSAATEQRQLHLGGWPLEGIAFTSADTAGQTSLLNPDDHTISMSGRLLKSVRSTGGIDPQVIAIERRGDLECLVIGDRLGWARDVGCADQMLLDEIAAGVIAVRASAATPGAMTWYLLEVESRSLRPLTVPEVIGPFPTLVTGMNGTSFVHVSGADGSRGIWLRWTPTTGALKQAPLPAAVDAVFQW